MTFHIYDCIFKNIFDTYPQGILDIINDVIAETFPDLILDFYPKAFWDSFPQELLNTCPEDFLKSDLFGFNFKRKLETEFFTKEGNKFIPDCPFDTFEDLIIGLEFQSSRLNYKRKTVFYEYQANLHFKHKKDVRMVVFSTVRNKHSIIRHRVGPNEEFTILIISLKALNQKQTLNNSLYKIRNKISLSDKEKALFLSSPMMDLGDKVGAINILLNNFHRISNLSDEEYDSMFKVAFIYAENWYCKETKNNYGGSDMVILPPSTQKLYDRILAEGMEKGMEKGVEKGVQMAISALNMVNGGCSLDEASKATGLSKSQISQLYGSK